MKYHRSIISHFHKIYICPKSCSLFLILWNLPLTLKLWKCGILVTENVSSFLYCYNTEKKIKLNWQLKILPFHLMPDVINWLVSVPKSIFVTYRLNKVVHLFTLPADDVRPQRYPKLQQMPHGLLLKTENSPCPVCIPHLMSYSFLFTKYWKLHNTCTLDF